MSGEIRRTGSEDQCLPSHASGDHDEPSAPEPIIACDSGRTDTCSGIATVERAVPYLREPLRLCAECLALEVREAEDGPQDDRVMNTCATEGGINDREWSRR